MLNEEPMACPLDVENKRGYSLFEKAVRNIEL